MKDIFRCAVCHCLRPVVDLCFKSPEMLESLRRHDEIKGWYGNEKSICYSPMCQFLWHYRKNIKGWYGYFSDDYIGNLDVIVNDIEGMGDIDLAIKLPDGSTKLLYDLARVAEMAYDKWPIDAIRIDKQFDCPIWEGCINYNHFNKNQRSLIYTLQNDDLEACRRGELTSIFEPTMERYKEKLADFISDRIHEQLPWTAADQIIGKVGHYRNICCEISRIRNSPRVILSFLP